MVSIDCFYIIRVYFDEYYASYYFYDYVIIHIILVHRIGRTGRAGKKGLAHTFFQTKADKLRAGELVKVLRDAGQTVPEKMLSFDLSIRKKEHKLYGAFGPKEHSNIPMKAPSKIVFGDDD